MSRLIIVVLHCLAACHVVVGFLVSSSFNVLIFPYGVGQTWFPCPCFMLHTTCRNIDNTPFSLTSNPFLSLVLQSYRLVFIKLFLFEFHVKR